MNGEDQVKRIQEKIQAMVRQQELLKKENRLLKEELEAEKKQGISFQEKAEQLKQQVELLRFTRADMNPEDKKQLEKRISGYLKEIDRCIAMLSE